MTQTAAPWWAEVQHLRPDEDAGTDDRMPRTGRLDRRPDHAAPAERFERRAERPERRGERPEPEVWLDAPAPEPEVWFDAPAAESKPEPKPERRTIEIRGQVDRVHGVAPVPSPGPQRIRGRRADERVGPRPDKVALWAVLLGLLLILVALVSSPGADAAAILAL
ncbi:MAG TPA: hypothetical protein VHF89_10715 [Solirubrobacteraceae bacterium]|nr:hypothetical protein [Solirubrobacteraceae bacterium]